MSDVSLVVNGKSVSANVEDRTLLVHFLRENLGLTGTHVGCDTSQCGACVVHVDGKAVKSCTMLAAQASGSEIVTIEGLADGADLHPVQIGVQGTSRAAVRFLHARNDHGGDRHDQPASGRARRGDGARTSSKATSAAAPDITTSSRRYWRLLQAMAKGSKGSGESGLSISRREQKSAIGAASRHLIRQAFPKTWRAPYSWTARFLFTSWFWRRILMGIEGIGARVARKEDKRFITGAGRYVDDMVVPGMKHAVFVRSPHAHAEITSIDVKEAKAMPGVIGVLTGKELKADGIGNHHLRLDDPFQGRLADEDGRVVAAGVRPGALCRRRGRGRGGRHQGPGARRRRGGRDHLQGTAVRSPTRRRRWTPASRKSIRKRKTT